LQTGDEGALENKGICGQKKGTGNICADFLSLSAVPSDPNHLKAAGKRILKVNSSHSRKVSEFGDAERKRCGRHDSSEFDSRVQAWKASTVYERIAVDCFRTPPPPHPPGEEQPIWRSRGSRTPTPREQGARPRAAVADEL
jgi:hypothetical protein